MTLVRGGAVSAAVALREPVCWKLGGGGGLEDGKFQGIAIAELGHSYAWQSVCRTFACSGGRTVYGRTSGLIMVPRNLERSTTTIPCILVYWRAGRSTKVLPGCVLPPRTRSHWVVTRAGWIGHGVLHAVSIREDEKSETERAFASRDVRVERQEPLLSRSILLCLRLFGHWHFPQADFSLCPTRLLRDQSGIGREREKADL